MTEQNEATPPPEPAAPAAALDRPRLKKLVIHRYRHVKPGTTLVFDDTWNVIVGKNGTGKTTLLKLIEAIVRGDPTALEARTHVEFVLEWNGVRIDAAVEWKCSPPRESLEVVRDEVDLRSTGTMTFANGDSRRWQRVPYSAHHEWIHGNGSSKTASSPRLWPRMPEHFHDTLWSCHRFDEALGYYDSIVGWRCVRRVDRNGVIGEGADEAFAARRSIYAPLPPQGLDFAGASAWVSHPQVWGRDEDPALGRFEELADLTQAKFELRPDKIQVDEEEVEVRYHPAELKIEKGGSKFGHNDLSFGQKRLLAFLYYLQMNAPILILDELSNGFHRNWIDYAVEQMQTLQNFAATQNPLLLDRIPFHSPEELQRSLIFCREEDGKFVWENAKADDMVEVYDAYDVGLEKVSDLLWRKGMW